MRNNLRGASKVVAGFPLDDDTSRVVQRGAATCVSVLVHYQFIVLKPPAAKWDISQNPLYHLLTLIVFGPY